YLHRGIPHYVLGSFKDSHLTIRGGNVCACANGGPFRSCQTRRSKDFQMGQGCHPLHATDGLPAPLLFGKFCFLDLGFSGDAGKGTEPFKMLLLLTESPRIGNSPTAASPKSEQLQNRGRDLNPGQTALLTSRAPRPASSHYVLAHSSPAPFPDHPVPSVPVPPLLFSPLLSPIS
ncbi:hypothetical protein INR49_002500, partial [Caranx melampygus]